LGYQNERKYMNETIVAPKVDSRFLAFRASLSRWFGVFGGTPLARAREIMGTNLIHDVEAVSKCLDVRELIECHRAYVEMVPYTEDELMWAAEHGFVLTLYTSTVRSLERRGVEVASMVAEECHELLSRRPRHPQWVLVLRPTLRGKEIAFLRKLPKKLKGRIDFAKLPLAVSTLFLDFKIHGIIPAEPRLTPSTIIDPLGTVRCRVVLGPNSDPKATTPIFVGASRPHMDYPFVTILKPHKIPYSLSR
jgi:hypothetical protein